METRSKLFSFETRWKYVRNENVKEIQLINLAIAYDIDYNDVLGLSAVIDDDDDFMV